MNTTACRTPRTFTNENAAGRRMSPLLDAHSHVVPAGLPSFDDIDSRLPRTVIDGESANVIIGERPFRTVSRVAWNLDARRVEMRGHGVDAAVLSPMPELFCYWSDAAVTRGYYESVNRWIAASVEEHPAVFRGLGIVPLQDPDLACEMLSMFAELGLVGVEVGSNVNGRSFADPLFRDFVDEAARLGLVVFVHAFHPPYAATHVAPTVDIAATYPPEIASYVLSLAARGTLARLPHARLFVSHGGGGAAWAIQRLEWLWNTDPQARDLMGISPRQTLSSLYFDSVVFGARGLRQLVDVVGADRVCAGSDYPFVREPADFSLVTDGSFTRDEIESMRHRSAGDLFRWHPPLQERGNT
ncbi:amidohydrolase family protein [Streptosporangium sp. NPDC006930]|uniref:amidohydrolase family protein n=1 Tax=unclassified Streptosporangium TaxID=2632669 RepID=UPI0034225BDE